MDEFIEVIRIQKKEPGNLENHKKMIVLSKTAHLAGLTERIHEG